MTDPKGFYPDWYDRAPPPRSYRAVFKWGSPNVFKHPNRQLYALMKERLRMTDEAFRSQREVGDERVSYDCPSRMSAETIAALREIVGDENVLTDDYSRLRVAYGKTMLDLMRLRKKVIQNLPDAVVCPRNRDDVCALVALCHSQRIPLTPYGGGTSVTRGVECVRGGISLDLGRHMTRILKVNPINQTATVEPGILGPDLEQALNDAPARFGTPHRYTCGHFPQSFEFASVGGWVVASGAGQNSTYYGKIESLVVSQEYITPVGEIATRELPADAMGPDIDQILIGSEGTFGVLVSVTLRLFRYLPENRRRFSFMFKDWDSAVQATREILQSEFGHPSIFRLSDPEETDVALKLYGVESVLGRLLEVPGYRRGKRCLLIGSADGHGSYTRAVVKGIKAVARRHGALYTTGHVTKAWEHGRFRDPYLREDLQDYGVVIDTLECAVAWDRLHAVWQAVRDYCHRRPHAVCMCHISHFYPQGANLYFIFIAKMHEIEDYLDYQGGILDTICREGAAVSHHHGIGKMIAPWLESALGKNQLEVLRALKRHFDPHNVMNPGGTLALDLPDSERRGL